MKDLKKIRDSIEKFNQSSIKEKDSLIDSIEMLWLNAGIQKKKKDIKLKSDSDEKYNKNKTTFGCSLV